MGRRRLPTSSRLLCSGGRLYPPEHSRANPRGANPLLCFRHVNGWFSAHGNMALSSSAQIQDNTLIASNSKSGRWPLETVWGTGKAQSKRKRQPLPYMPWEPGGFLTCSSPQERAQGRGEGGQGKRRFMCRGSPTAIRGSFPSGSGSTDLQ